MYPTSDERASRESRACLQLPSLTRMPSLETWARVERVWWDLEVARFWRRVREVRAWVVDEEEEVEEVRWWLARVRRRE